MVATIVVSTIMFSTAASLRSQNERARFAQSQLLVLKDISSVLSRMTKEVSDYLLLQKEEEFEEYQRYKTKLNILLNRYEQITNNEIAYVEDEEKEQESAELEVTDRLRKDVTLIILTAGSMMESIHDGEVKFAVEQLENTLELIYDEGFVEILEQQIQDEEDEIQAVYHKLMALTYRLQSITIITLAGMMIIIGGVALLVLRDIYQPLASLVTMIEEIGKGKFNIDIQIHARNEISALAISLKKMATELQRAQSQLVQSAKLASIGQLAAGVAHELNQPLMVIRMNTQILLKQLQQSSAVPPQDLETSLTMIERNTSRMTHIINHLRTFSRQTNSVRELLDINQVIESSFTMINEQLRIHDIEVKKHFSFALPPIRGNANELEQVFINLLANSRDALLEVDAAGPKRIEITTSRQSNQYIEVIVSDTGIGIATENAEKIFDPFYTTKPVGKGTGLGLSIAYGIIREHNGRITLMKTKTPGATFQIDLPGAEDENADN